MTTQFVTSSDGTQIAYDVTGAGSALILLHGGGHDRRSMHEGGYVERLAGDFQVITIDIRGNGESDKPTDPAAYTTEKHCQDILAVADACGVEQFGLFGVSYGGNIGRYLAATSERVAYLIMIGIPFGAAAAGGFRQYIEELLAFWPPILQAQSAGTLDLLSLSEDDREDLLHENIPLRLAWLGAMLDWHSIEPTDVRCPTLWVVGSENKAAMESVEVYSAAIKTSKVQVQIFAGLNHRQEFTEIDTVLPDLVRFAKTNR